MFTWQEIVASDGFRGLSLEDKERVRSRYFDDFVLPNAPEGLDPKEIRSVWDAKTRLTRTWGEAGSDLAMSFGSGSGALLEGAGTLYGLATGDMDNAARTAGAETSEFYNRRKSAALKAAEEERARKIAESDGFLDEAGTAIVETVKNPALIGSFLAEQVPMFVGPGAIGRIGKAVGWVRAAIASAIGAGAAMQAGDVSSDAYEQAKKLALQKGASEEEAEAQALAVARKVAPAAGAISVASQFLPGGRTIERVLGGADDRIAGRGIGLVRGALGEGVSEAVEEGFGKVSSNVGMQEIDPSIPLAQGAGEAAGLGLLGGVAMGGVTGAAESPRRSDPVSIGARILAAGSIDEAIQQAQIELSEPEFFGDRGSQADLTARLDEPPYAFDPAVQGQQREDEREFQREAPPIEPRAIELPGVQPSTEPIVSPVTSTGEQYAEALAKSQRGELLTGYEKNLLESPPETPPIILPYRARDPSQMTDKELDLASRLTRSPERRAELSAELVRRAEIVSRGITTATQETPDARAVEDAVPGAAPAVGTPIAPATEIERTSRAEAQPAQEAVAEKAPIAAEEAAPEFEDFARRRDGMVRSFSTEKLARAYALQKTNRVPGDFAPRFTDRGDWVLSRPAKREAQSDRTIVRSPDSREERSAASEPQPGALTTAELEPADQEPVDLNTALARVKDAADAIRGAKADQVGPLVTNLDQARKSAENAGASALQIVQAMETPRAPMGLEAVTRAQEGKPKEAASTEPTPKSGVSSSEDRLRELVRRYKPDNPFAERAARARFRYERLSSLRSAHDEGMAQAFPLGAGFGRRGAEKRIESTVNKAVETVEALKNADYLEAQASAFDAGQINSQGRSITPGTRDRAEKREAQKESREERIAAARAAREGKERWQVTQKVYADSTGNFAGGARQLVERDHRGYVESALAAGKDVPAEVLADYPDLRPTLTLTPESESDSGRRLPGMAQDKSAAAKTPTPAAAGESEGTVRWVNQEGERWQARKVATRAIDLSELLPAHAQEVRRLADDAPRPLKPADVPGTIFVRETSRGFAVADGFSRLSGLFAAGETRFPITVVTDVKTANDSSAGDSTPALGLSGETESEIRAREAREAKEAEEKKKREAAPAASGFTLTGSDRTADEAEARGQEPMFARRTGKQPWEMTLEEFRTAVKRGRLHRATGRKVPGEESAKTPLRMGELNGYSGDDIAHFYAVRRGFPDLADETYDPVAVARDELREDAVFEGHDVPREIGTPAFSRGAEGGSSDSRAVESLLPARIREVLEPIVAGWTNGPDLEVIASMDEAPKAVRQLDERLLAQGATGKPYAFFHGGKVYLVASEITNERQAVTGLFHEALGHYGLRGLYGQELNNILTQIVVGRRTDVAAKAKEYGLDMGKRADRLVAAEEILAEFAQTRPESSFVQRTVSIVRNWLRTHGFDLEWTDNDIIESFIIPARNWVERGYSKSTIEQEPTFARDSRGESARFARTPSWVSEGDEDLKSAVSKIDTYALDKSFKEKVKDLSANWKERTVQLVFDAYAPLKRLGPKEYVMARMVKAADGALEGTLLYGKPVMGEDGVIRGEIDHKGFLGAMQELKGEHDRFFLWIAGNRAERLMGEGREHLFTAAEIKSMKALTNGKMKDGTPRPQAYAKAAETLRSYNTAILDIAEKTGLIDGESRHLWEHDFYVPFFRMDEDMKLEGPTRVKGLVRQQAFKKLKGGTEPLGDLLDNTLRNWSHLISASMANQAAVANLKAATQVGIARKLEFWETKDGAPKGATYVMVNGEKVHYEVDDPFILTAISSMEATSFKGLPMELMGTFKHYLTLGVTVSPTFRIRNLLRDSLSAIGQNEMSYNVMKNVVQGFKGTNRKSEAYAQMLFNGALMRFGYLTDGKHAEHAKRLINMGVDEGTILTSQKKVEAAIGKMWDEWQEFGDRMENINRTAIYQQAKERGLSDMEAAFMARDMLDFSLQGSWVAVRFLTQIVPFMNARLQGLYKMGRAGKENPARLGYVAGSVALASIALMLAYSDDDEWKKREDWDRDNFWWFRIGDTAYRIPKPFEIGAIGTLAERSLELLINDEMNGKRYRERLMSMMGDTLSLNPTPQLFKPLVDLYANKDSFTGRQIESRGMENLSKSERMTPYTSIVARIIGKAGVASPVQVDHVIRAYFGWFGSHLAMAVDVMAQPFMDSPKPERRLEDYFVIGDFVKDLPSSRSRYVEDFYKQAKAVHEVMGDLRAAREVNDLDKMKAILENKGSEVALARMYGRAERRMGAINREIRRVHNSRQSAEEKRQELDRLTAMRNELARVVSERATARREAEAR